MTLDEAIKRAEEAAEENQKVIDTGIVFNDMTIDMLCCDDTEVIEEHLANYQRCADEHRQLAEWLKELKQLREQSKWIPVSERLPGIADVYRVTRYYPNSVTDINYLVDACFFDGSNTWYNDNRINHERNYVINVIAWQENPEPYKAESGEV